MVAVAMIMSPNFSFMFTSFLVRRMMRAVALGVLFDVMD
jgi:hypothetical protein